MYIHMQIIYCKSLELYKYYLFQIFHKFTYLQILSLILQLRILKQIFDLLIDFSSIKFYNILRKNINLSFEYIIMSFF